jgi:hypothetical protein
LKCRLCLTEQTCKWYQKHTLCSKCYQFEKKQKARVTKICYNNPSHSTSLSKRGVPIWTRHPEIKGAFLCSLCRYVGKKRPDHSERMKGKGNPHYGIPGWNKDIGKNRTCSCCGKSTTRWHKYLNDGWCCDTCYRRQRFDRHHHLDQSKTACDRCHSPFTRTRYGFKIIIKDPDDENMKICRPCLARRLKSPKFCNKFGSKYKTGISTRTRLIKAIRVMPEYKRMQHCVYNRDNYQCQWPGCSQTEMLDIHHVIQSLKSLVDAYNIEKTSDALEYSKFFDADYCIVLCREHHKLTYDYHKNR